jgi:transcriptional regulator with XRE-family HTH domain
MPNTPPRPTLGQRIRDARVEAELSLRELARRIECAPSYLNDIEHDRRVPSEAVLRRLVAELSLDADLLLAAAGRVGEEAEQYMRSNPTAGVLFRRVSGAGLGEQDLKQLLDHAEKMIHKREQSTDE